MTAVYHLQDDCDPFCQEQQIHISLEQENGEDVLYLRLYDKGGRRGNFALPYDVALFFVSRTNVSAIGYGDECGDILLDRLGEYIALSTGHGDVHWTVGEDFFVVLEQELMLLVGRD